MSGSDIKFGIQLVFDGKAAGGEISISREQFRALASDAKRAGEAVAGGFTGAAKGVRSVSEMMAQARNLTAGFFGVRELAQASDAWTNLASRMALVAPTAKDSAAAMSAVFDIAQKSGQSLSAIGDVYTKIARNALQYNLSAKEVATTTLAIANAVRISGGTAASTSAALIQLGQALASGTLRGEELNSVMEQTPALAEAIARGMGKTIGDLRKMGEAGQLAAGEVLAAINKEAARLEAEVARMAPTIAIAVNQLNNAFQKWAGGANGAAGSAAAGGIAALAQNFSGVADAALIAGGALTGMKLGQWAASAVGAVSAAGSIAAAIAQMNPWVRGATVAVGALTTSWVAWQRLKGSPLDGVADQARAVATELAKTTTEVKRLTLAQYEAQIQKGEASLTDSTYRVTDLGNRIAADPGIHAKARKGDSGAKALLDEYASLTVARGEIQKNLVTLRSGYTDIGTAAQEAFTKNDAFMTKAAKQTEVLGKAGEAYAKAWLAAANGPPAQIGARRAEAYAQFQGFIAETLDYKGTAEARADALVAAAKSSAARAGEQFKQALEHYRMSSADFIRQMAALETSTLETERRAVAGKQPAAPKDKIAKDARLAEINAEIADVGEKYARMAEDIAKKRESALEKMNAELGKLARPDQRAAASMMRDHGADLRRAAANGDQETLDTLFALRAQRESAETFGDLGKQFDAQIKQMEASLASTQIGVQLGGLTADAAEFAERGIRQNALPGLLALRAQMAAAADGSEPLKLALAELDKRLAQLGIELARPLPPQNIFESAAAASRLYLAEIGSVARQQAEMFTRSFKGMEDALVSFVKTGKLDFRSLADSIISDLIRMQWQASVTTPFAKAAQGAGGLGGLLGGLLDFRTPPYVPSQGFGMAGDAGTLLGFAGGGDHGGGWRIVGENGPELEATGPSRIFNAGQTRDILGGAGGGGSNITVNIIESSTGGGQVRQRSEGGRQVIDVMVAKVKSALISDVATNGDFARSAQGAWGLNRAAGGY